ncbi:MAG: aminotransferase class I/II-fold pyridoxal phosphate-dependent enzyme [Gammaproteobacteria bacterium]
MNFQAFDLPQLRARQSRKWRSYPEDVIPAWIADMDFPIAAAIQHELERIVATNDYGYPGRPPKDDPVFDIFAERALARFGWVVDPWRMECLVDVVQGIYLALQLYSEPGDGVVILTPSYPPFLHAAKDTGRTAVCHTLSVGAEGEYEIDFERLANTIDARTRILLLCSPHNPTGRVWRRAELEALADLALRHDLIVLADEIHADLVYPGNRHMPFATLGPEIESRTITFTRRLL